MCNNLPGKYPPGSTTLQMTLEGAAVQIIVRCRAGDYLATVVAQK